MEIRKGEQCTVRVRFLQGRAQFLNPPKWTVFNSDDEAPLSAPATLNGDRWEAVFTIPTRYVVTGGRENLTVQFEGYDKRNAQFITDKTVTLIDNAEDFKPSGVVYNMLTRHPVKDSVVSADREELTIATQVFDPYGMEKFSLPAVTTNSSGSFTGGTEFPVRLDLKNAALENRYTDPHQIVYTLTGDEGYEDSEIHPLYLLDHKILSVVNSLTTFLDKARLQEIDPSLQWNLEELIQSVLEGMKWINGVEPEGTFWSPRDFPPTLDRFLFAASAHYALNMRLMAEGFNSFEFQGLNTSLNYNRTEILNAKIDEMNNVLERLPAAKRSAIAINGKGTAPPGVNDMRRRNLGALRLGVNRLNNRPGWGRQHRFFTRT